MVWNSDWPNAKSGNIPPAEAEVNFYAATAAMDNVQMAA
jgi:hypothetical protein